MLRNENWRIKKKAVVPEAVIYKLQVHGHKSCYCQEKLLEQTK